MIPHCLPPPRQCLSVLAVPSPCGPPRKKVLRAARSGPELGRAPHDGRRYHRAQAVRVHHSPCRKAWTALELDGPHRLGVWLNAGQPRQDGRNHLGLWAKRRWQHVLLAIAGLIVPALLCGIGAPLAVGSAFAVWFHCSRAAFALCFRRSFTAFALRSHRLLLTATGRSLSWYSQLPLLPLLCESAFFLVVPRLFHCLFPCGSTLLSLPFHVVVFSHCRRDRRHRPVHRGGAPCTRQLGRAPPRAIDGGGAPVRRDAGDHSPCSKYGLSVRPNGPDHLGLW